MMVPRAYHYATGPPSRSPSPSKRRKESPARPAKPALPLRSKSSNERLPVVRKLTTLSPAMPSKPVVIPTRTQSAKSRRVVGLRSERSAEKEGWVTESPTIPPSMAALLAITALPPPKGMARRRKGSGRNGDADLSLDDFRHSVSSSSPRSWSILQSSPDDDDDDDSRTEKSVDADTDASSVTSNGRVRPSASFRSFSSESTPSLEIDLDSESLRSISPPMSTQRPKFRVRRDRIPSPAIPISSDSEHPLATATYPESSSPSPPPTATADNQPQEVLFTPAQVAGTSTTSFKSNLTASLRLLKTAAKVLSAPARLHDPAALTVFTDTSGFAPGNRNPPRPPDFYVSANIDDLPLHLSAQLPGPVPTMSIQLQPCHASPLSTPTASAPPIFLAASNPPADPYQKKPFQREPRENSDFLRVVVCEMNMRRAGKLTGEGRARICLGARQEVKKEDTASATPGIADGAKGQGAVMLDGEMDEAREMDPAHEHQHHLPTTTNRSSRSNQRIPQRWVPLVP